MRTRPHNRRKISATVTAMLCLLAAPLAAGSVEWSRIDGDCTGAQSSYAFSCGPLGTYHFGNVTVPAQCSEVASGVGIGSTYPRQLEAEPALAPLEGLDTTASTQPLQPLVSSDAWIAVVDYGDQHGWSVSSLISQIAGEVVRFSALDDPSRAALGPAVGDAHVLAALCEIADGVATEQFTPPTIINLSFGRVQENDLLPPVGQPAVAMLHDEIASVVNLLEGQGATLIGAAGNHQEMLFPASLGNVLAVGALEPNALLHAAVLVPAWESPVTAEAWLPATSFCIGSWAAPSGSSYATALMSGWALEAFDVHNLNHDGLWYPWIDAELECARLWHNGSPVTTCNPAVDDLFLGLGGQFLATCWSAPQGDDIVTPLPADPTPMPSVYSLARYAEAIQATPEADPCIPCLDLGRSRGGNDMVVDMSQSRGVPAGIEIESVYLRMGSQFYRLPLGPSQLQAIEEGNLGTMTVQGGGSIALSSSVSFWFELRDDPQKSCPQGCFWTSSQIYRLP